MSKHTCCDDPVVRLYADAVASSLGFYRVPEGQPGKPKRARRGVAVVIIRTLGCMQTRVVIRGVWSMLCSLYGCLTLFWVRLGVEAYLMRSMFTSEGAIATVAERSCCDYPHVRLYADAGCD